jgi:hypothetical protein
MVKVEPRASAIHGQAHAKFEYLKISLKFKGMDGPDIVSKGAFAAFVGVSCARVSQWIAKKQISGDALVGTGHRAKIRVPVALAQLRRNLDIDRHLGMKGKAKLDARPIVVPIDTARPPPQEPPVPEPDSDATLEGRIKLQRLDQLSLANAAARVEAAARSGRYVKAEDARQEMGRIAARLMTLFESGLTEMANAIIAAPPGTPRDASRLLRATWRGIRERYAERIGAEAETLPPLIDDEEGLNAKDA